jgi:2-keto-4-pentenoate hydratase
MATDIAAAAAALLEARRSRTLLKALPEGSVPTNLADVYAIQKLVADALGPVVAWKVGAATPEAEPGCAPIHADSLYPDGATLPAKDFNVTGIEAEIGYLLKSDLPPRDAPYSREEVLDAVASLHPMIEVVDTRFVALKVTDPMSHNADQGSHGALITGPALTDWRNIDPLRQPLKLTFNGKVAVEHIGGNSAGEPVRLIQWLADKGARAYGGLKAGMVITTGSCSGNIPVPAGTVVRAEFPGLGVVGITIG